MEVRKKIVRAMMVMPGDAGEARRIWVNVSGMGERAKGEKDHREWVKRWRSGRAELDCSLAAECEKSCSDGLPVCKLRVAPAARW